MSDNDQNPGFRGRHTPEFAQQAMRALRLLKRVTDDDPVEQRIREWQPLVLHQRGQALSLGRPAFRALQVRGCRNHPPRACPIRLQQRIRMPKAQHVQTIGRRPQRTHALGDHLVRHAPES